MRLAIVAGLLLLQPGSAAAQQQAPLELAPTSPWAMNYDADSCALQRQFGEDGQQVFLELRKFGPSTDMQVVVASRDFAVGTANFHVKFNPTDVRLREMDGNFTVELDQGYRGRLFEHDLLYDNDERNALFAAFVGSLPDLEAGQRERLLMAQTLARRIAVTQGNAQAVAQRGYVNILRAEGHAALSRRVWRDFSQQPAYADLAERQARAVTGLLLDDAFDQPISLRTGNLAAAMQAMDACLDELMLHWGIDPVAHEHLSRQVEPQDYDRLAREIMESYPRDMARQRIQAFVRVRLAVSEEGTTTACNLQSDYNATPFEQVVCEKMLAARFNPALDAAGQPIASYYQVAVVYRPY